MNVAASRFSRTPVVLLAMQTESVSAQEQVLHLARGLMGSNRFSPLLATPPHSPLRGRAKEEGIPHISLRGEGLFSLRGRWKLKKTLQDSHSVIVHSQDMPSAVLAHALTKALPGLVHVHTKRDALPIPSGKGGKALREARAVVVLSSSMGALMTAGGVEGGRVRIIPSGIDPASVPKCRSREDSRFIFAVMGDLTPENGHEVLVRALPILERYDDIPDWEIRILGEGPLFHPLLELAMTLGVKGRLAILGRQNGNSILPYCDGLIAPAVSASLNGEDNGEPLREGWAVGLPVVASNLLAHCELARERENCLIYPMDDPAALAAHMADIARDPALRRQLRAGGETSLLACTARDMADAYHSLYESLLFPGKRHLAP